jgi:hypothetical protein
MHAIGRRARARHYAVRVGGMSAREPRSLSNASTHLRPEKLATLWRWRALAAVIDEPLLHRR